MATSVATPLERHLGAIAGVTEMTSRSTVGNARITLQFDLDRAASTARRATCRRRSTPPAPTCRATCAANPQYRKVNPADAPVLILALTSDTLGQGRLYDAASNILQQKLSQVTGVGQVTLGGSSLPAVRVEINPTRAVQVRHRPGDVRAALAAANANTPKGAHRGRRPALPDLCQRPGAHGRRIPAPDHRLAQRRAGAAVGRGRGHRRDREHPQPGPGQRQARGAGDHLPAARRQRHRDRRRGEGAAARAAGGAAQRRRPAGRDATAPPPSAPRCRRSSRR